MSIFSKVTWEGKPAKLEVFNKKHKLFKSLPVHKQALAAGLRVPDIYKVENKAGNIYKYTEWVQGNTIYDEMNNNTDSINTICLDIARYINILYDVDGISPVDNHLKNFVWTGKEVVYIDMKKLLYMNYSRHLIQMSKLCLKNFRGDRSKVLSFLKGYNYYRDVRPVLKSCDECGWKWVNKKHGYLHTETVKIEEIING